MLAKRNSVLLIALLVTAGCSPSAREQLDGMQIRFTADAFVQAAADGRPDVVSLFLEAKMAPDATNQHGNTALLHAAVHGRTGIARTLLDAGADPDYVGPGQMTPLLLAASHGHAEMVDELLRQKVQVDRKEAQLGMTSLGIASFKGYTNIVKSLLQHRAGVNEADNTGATPLLRAAQSNHVGIAQCLVNAGAATDRTDQHGISPLILAAYHGQQPLVTALLKAGAPINHRTAEGDTAWSYAWEQGHTDIIELLNDAGAVPPPGYTGGWKPFAAQGRSYSAPAQWTAFDPFTDQTRYWPSLTWLRTEPRQNANATRRALLRSPLKQQAQIFLLLMPASDWAARETDAWRRWEQTDWSKQGEQMIHTADGTSLRCRWGRSASDSLVVHLLASAQKDGQALIVDAGGRVEANELQHWFDCIRSIRWLSPLEL